MQAISHQTTQILQGKLKPNVSLAFSAHTLFILSFCCFA